MEGVAIHQPPSPNLNARNCAIKRAQISEQFMDPNNARTKVDGSKWEDRVDFRNDNTSSDECTSDCFTDEEEKSAGVQCKRCLCF